MKKVVYNGGTESFFGCSGNPKDLTVGKIYEVLKENDRGYQTDYTLKGVRGAFNSVWFTTLRPTYFAVGETIPVVGESYHCKKVATEGIPRREGWITSVVRSVEPIGVDAYKVITMNSIYLVKIH